MTYSYVPQGVCAKRIDFELSDDGKTLESVEFTGGCPGNLQAISKLLKGMPVETVIELLEGNTCGKKGTSCTDQLTKALRAAI